MIVLAIVAVGAVILIFLPLQARKGSLSLPDPLTVTGVHLDHVKKACRAYRRATGNWPTSVAALSSVIFVKDPNIFSDGWGHPIVLRALPNITNEMWLLSTGPKELQSGKSKALASFSQ